MRCAEDKDDQLCVDGTHSNRGPGKGGLKTVSRSFVEGALKKKGEISGSQLLCCATSVLGRDEAQDTGKIAQLYEIVIRELERFLKTR